MAWSIFSLSARLFFRRMGILLQANVLWLLLSLLLVTWPAATAGLFYLIHRIVREERVLDPHTATLRDFWIGFRRYGLRSTKAVLASAALFLLVGVSLRFYMLSPVVWLQWLSGPVFVVGLAWLGAQIYFLPLLIVEPKRPLLAVARRSLLLAVSYPSDTIMLLIWLLLVTAVSLVLAGPVILLLFAFLALTQTLALRFVRVRSGEAEPAQLPQE